MNERVPAQKKTSATPPQATQASSPLLHQSPLTSELSESVGSNSNISKELGGIQPKTIRRSLNWQNIPVEAPSRGNGMSLSGGIQRQQEGTPAPDFYAEVKNQTGPFAKKAVDTALERFDMSNDPSANAAVFKAWLDTFTNKWVSERQSGSDEKIARKKAKRSADDEAKEVAKALATKAALERATTDLQSGNAFKDDPNTKLVRNEYDQGTRGGNAKSLSPRLAGHTLAEIIDILDTDVTAGRGTKSTSNLQMPNGKPPKPQIGYQYPDGTLVRVKPDGDAFLDDPMYSVEVTNNTSGPVTGQDDIAFKVGTDGKAVPKGPNDVNNPYNIRTNAEQYNTYGEEVLKAGHLTAQPNPPSTNPPPTSP